MTLEAVESTAPADGRGIDQSVPSYYALPVGDIDVVVISDGLPVCAGGVGILNPWAFQITEQLRTNNVR